VYDIVQQLAIIDDDVLDYFGIDTIELGRGFALRDEDWAPWILPDGTLCEVPAWSVPYREPNRWVIRSTTGRVIAQMPDGAIYFEQTYYPFFEKADLEAIPQAQAESMWTAIASPPGPLVQGPGGDDALREGSRRLRDKSTRAILGLFGGNLLEMGQFLYRNDGFLLLLAENPDQAHAFLDRIVESHLKNLEHFLRIVGQSIDIIVFGDDLGMQDRPLMSRNMYMKYLMPGHQKLFQYVHQHSNCAVFLHSCGSIYPLIPDLITAGVDILNPVQTSAKNMDPQQLKSEFGGKLTFWGGGCDTQHVLAFATPAEIAQHVRERIQIFAPGGGFVFNPIHNIQADVPPENIVSMFDTALEFNYAS
jgi:uroporphyrinogen decarboxylase